MHVKAKLLKRKKVFEGYCFNVVIDDVVWPNRKRLKRDLILHPGISVIVPLLDQSHMILLRQYRYGAKKVLWELPAGTIDQPESALSCAKRELEEEIGYSAGQWQKIANCFASPGFNTEVINCFVAAKLKKTSTRLEDDEILIPKVIPIREVKQMVSEGKIQDAKSLVALFHFFDGRSKR